MSRRSGYQARAVALGAFAAVTVAVAAVTIGVAEAGGTAWPAGASVAAATVAGPAAADTYTVGAAAQRGALAHWTAQRMRVATATALPRAAAGPNLPAIIRTPGQPNQNQAVADVTAPRGTPRAVPFAGSPTTGALFYTTGGRDHFCTASVVDSTAGDIALTAAHCVYWKGFATNIEYVPGYHNGKLPYGAWPVKTITVAAGWRLSHNPDLDFAFLTIAPVRGRSIQARTGGLTIRFTRWYSEKIEVIGHNDSGAEPIRCATRSFRFRTGQMEFYCHGFWTGTSGGPWIIGYNARNGTGTVFGVIGGYHLGGDYEWASYSPYFGPATRILYTQVVRAATPHPTPTPTPTPSKTPTKTPTTPPPTPTPTTTTTAATTTAYPPATPDVVSSAYRAPTPIG